MIVRLDYHKDQRGWDVMEAASGRVAWDVGANIGQSTRVLADRFKSVLAFEPCWESYGILYREMPDNVEALPFAVGREDGDLRLDITELSFRTGQLVSPGRPLPVWGGRRGTRTVPCRSLDSLMMHNPPPDFVKVDVEGGEVEVIAGGRVLFDRVRPQIIIEVHRAEHGDEIRRRLPRYDLVELRHGTYVKAGGQMYNNHYWLVDERALPDGAAV